MLSTRYGPLTHNIKFQIGHLIHFNSRPNNQYEINSRQNNILRDKIESKQLNGVIILITQTLAVIVSLASAEIHYPQTSIEIHYYLSDK